MLFLSTLKLLVVPQSAQIEMIKAPVQRSSPSTETSSTSGEKKEDLRQIEENEQLVGKREASPIDFLIRLFARWAGTVYMFALMWIILVAWIIFGIVTKASDNWQISIQDGQSIQTYIWDTLLMRQQLDDTNSFLKLFSLIKSRSRSHLKLLKLVKATQRETLGNVGQENIEQLEKEADFNDTARVELKAESKFDKISSKMSQLMGSLVCVCIYWSLIFVWVGCGKLPLGTGEMDENGNETTAVYSDSWQMIANTGTAVVLLVASVFLQNVRTRNDQFVREQIEQLIIFDARIEKIERKITDNYEENETIEMKPLMRKGLRKVISKYADIIGTGLGLIITVMVFIAWVAVGNCMKWSSNWWLIIGTYTGLVGFIDGFVLREVYFSITKYEEVSLLELVGETRELLREAEIDVEIPEIPENKTISFKVSRAINLVCSNRWSVLASVIAVVALLVIATCMMWSVTGQLICNTPTMIIEGFFLLILLQAHGWADSKRRKVLDQLKLSRELLYKYVSLVYKNSNQ